MATRSIVVRENGPLQLSEELEESQWLARLRRLSETARFPIFNFSGKSVRAAAVVGTVTCGGVRIEIHPKSSSDDATRDRHFLVNLLRASGYSPRRHAAPGRIAAWSGDPIDILIAELAENVVKGLNAGLPKRYERLEKASTVIRGRINFSKLSSRLPATPLLPLRNTVLTPDNELSRLIKWTLQTLYKIAQSLKSKADIRRGLIQLADVDVRGFSTTDIRNVALSRPENRWQHVVSIAQQLVQGRSLDPTISGTEDGIALVFKLDQLFERALRRVLALALPGNSVTLSHYTDELYMLESDDGTRSAVRVRPDYVFRRDEHPIAIGDAKWKALDNDAQAFGMKPGDIYQISAYLTRYGLRSAVMLYPMMPWMGELWKSSWRVPQTEQCLHFVGVDLEALVSADHATRARAIEGLSRILRGLFPP